MTAGSFFPFQISVLLLKAGKKQLLDLSWWHFSCCHRFIGVLLNSLEEDELLLPPVLKCRNVLYRSFLSLGGGDLVKGKDVKFSAQLDVLLVKERGGHFKSGGHLSKQNHTQEGLADTLVGSLHCFPLTAYALVLVFRSSLGGGICGGWFCLLLI